MCTIRGVSSICLTFKVLNVLNAIVFLCKQNISALLFKLTPENSRANVGFILMSTRKQLVYSLPLDSVSPVLEVCGAAQLSGDPPQSRCEAGMRCESLPFVRLRCFGLKCDFTAEKTTKQTAITNKESSYTPGGK